MLGHAQSLHRHGPHFILCQSAFVSHHGGFLLFSFTYFLNCYDCEDNDDHRAQVLQSLSIFGQSSGSQISLLCLLYLYVDIQMQMKISWVGHPPACLTGAILRLCLSTVSPGTSQQFMLALTSLSAMYTLPGAVPGLTANSIQKCSFV